jgi:hypothetical protein
MSQTIIDAIKRLELEISNKKTALVELKKMIGEESLAVLDSYDKSLLTSSLESSINKPFPINSRADKKILYLFQNVFQAGMRMSQIQDAMEKYNGSPLRVDNTVRRMKDDGSLSAVKYNNQNKMTFWGLNDWINFDEKDFKSTYKPSEDELPLNMTSSDLISINVKSARNVVL